MFPSRIFLFFFFFAKRNQKKEEEFRRILSSYTFGTKEQVHPYSCFISILYGILIWKNLILIQIIRHIREDAISHFFPICKNLLEHKSRCDNIYFYFIFYLTFKIL